LSGPTTDAQLLATNFTGAANQFWTFKPVESYGYGSYFILYNAGTGQVMDDFNGSTSAGNVIGQWSPNGGNNQNWALTPVAAAPTAPVGLTADAGDGEVSLHWMPGSGAASYNVKRSTISGAEAPIMNVSGPAYTDAAVANGATYYYVVSALDSGGESSNSVEASATPAAIVLLTARMYGSQPSFQFGVLVGQSYIVEMSTNLIRWTPLATNTPTENGTLIFTDTNGWSSPRFYRVLQ
jgi:hypothetical protein